MLQQTQAARVVPYYEAFLARFPDAARSPPRRRATCSPRGAASATTAARWRSRRAARGRRRARLAGRPDRAARRRPVHRGRRRVVRLGRAARRRRRQRPPRASSAGTGAATPPRRARRARRRAAARRPRGGVEPGDDGARRDGLHRPRRATAARARSRAWCASAGAPPPVRGGRAPRPRFEDTDRYARGRVVAALLAREALPDLAPERLERALAGLARDGLIVRDAPARRRCPDPRAGLRDAASRSASTSAARTVSGVRPRRRSSAPTRVAGVRRTAPSRMCSGPMCRSPRASASRSESSSAFFAARENGRRPPRPLAERARPEALLDPAPDRVEVDADRGERVGVEPAGRPDVGPERRGRQAERRRARPGPGRRARPRRARSGGARRRSGRRSSAAASSWARCTTSRAPAW